jgi:F0F1-type ATP synthase membrane subunit b/b'
MTRDEFFATVVPALLSFLSVALPALLAWIGTIFKSWKDKQNEATDRQALHSALTAGIQSAEQKYKNAPDQKAQEKVAYAIDYAKKSVPDAIANLRASTETLTKLTQSKLQQEEKNPCPPNTPQPSLPPLS